MFRYLLLLFFVLVVFPRVTAQQSINQLDANGKKTGVWMKKYSNGNLRYKGQFVHGKEVGVFKFYTEAYSSRPSIIKTYESQNPVCKVQFFTDTGVLQSVGGMIGRQRTGKWLYYDGTGKRVILEENYKNDKLSGEKKIYYQDGTLTEVSHYKNGLLDGESLRYTDQGKLIEKVPYVQGKIHGKIYYYHNTGVIRETGHYDHGKRVGRWEFYIDGELAGFEEPNKKVVKKPISMEEINARKQKK